MSGSSLDGLDIAYCEFEYDEVWSYKILLAETIDYPEEWLLNLKKLPNSSGEILTSYDISYGKYLGEKVRDFVYRNKLEVDLVGSHGHTIYHNPEKGYTFQLGNGQALAAEARITTISDFRTGDILNGGQGAPLVPIGDNLLFSEFDYCINIGGIANISFDDGGKRVAFDICPANQLLNYLSQQLGSPYDASGNFAQLGKLDINLFNKLNNHSYYTQDYPKSMSNQLVTGTFIPIIDDSESSVEDKLYTVCKHIACQVNMSLRKEGGSKVLITGGGAHNSFLMTAIKKETLIDVVIPEKEIVDFKEAMIFAFMGVLKLRGEVNCLASSTGALVDSSSGVVHEV